MTRLMILLLCVCGITSINALKGQPFYNTSIPNKYVGENIFLKKRPDTSRLPNFDSVRSLLPQPNWSGNPAAIESYWRLWELEFGYIRQVTPANGFVSPYVEPPFNGHIFMWDACFMTLFGRYGARAFNFQQTLDNFYAKQHRDGFICREITMENGEDFFEKFDPSSTGPNLLPWVEWEYFLNVNDTTRLQDVFAPLIAYYQWYRTNRTWPDGSYFSSGWGSGMDNQPRLPKGDAYDPRFSTGSMTWIDITLQQILVGKILVKMGAVLNRLEEVQDIADEVTKLTMYAQQHLWDDASAFFYDRFRDGSRSTVKSIASFWALLALVVPEHKLDAFVDHLSNPNEFARKHRVATLSADVPGFDPGGGYWCGAVWAPTNYMVLKGLSQYKKDSLAFEIALNHVQHVTEVYKQTGTFWENYAPDFISGSAMKNFVGWNGLIGINDLFEYVFGIRPNVPARELVIDVRLTDAYGVKKYPYGKSGLLDIQCAGRKKDADQPVITITSNERVSVIVKWRGGEKKYVVQPGTTKLSR